MLLYFIVSKMHKVIGFSYYLIVLIHIDLRPKFTGSPQLIDKTIRGCKYNNIFALNSKFTYLLINDKRRNFPDIQPSRKRRSTGDVSTEFPVFSLQSYDDVGEVKCAVFDPDRMTSQVVSKAIFVPFQFRKLIYFGIRKIA